MPSNIAGYLIPTPTPAPLEDEAFEDFLQEVVVGITGITNTLVRPRWQSEPPNLPVHTVNWIAIGINSLGSDPGYGQPAIVHVDTGEGFDALQRMELVNALTSFYGPNGSSLLEIFKDGIFIPQNRAVLSTQGVALVEVGTPVFVPELIKQRWYRRFDLPVVFRREIRRNYSVLNLLRARGTISGAAEDRVVENDFDTDAVED